MKTIIYISAWVLLTACKKEKITPHTTVNGQVVNEYDGRPVPFATVFLITEERGCLGNMGCAKQVMTTQADADGKYSFAFDWVNDNFYSVDAKDGAGWYEHFMPTVSISIKGKANPINIKMIPYGVTPIRLKNVKLNTYQISISNLYKSFSGDNLDTLIFLGSVVNKNNLYQITGGVDLMRGGDSSFIISYPIPPPCDTAKTVVEILY